METIKPKSPGSGKKWLMGCGIGCAVVIALIAVLLVGGFFFVRNITDKFEETSVISAELMGKFGPARDFHPEADGSIPSSRLEAFLSVREAMTEARGKMDRSLEVLSEAEIEGRKRVKAPGHFLNLMRTAGGIASQVVDFYTKRNQTLLEVEMGLGEYIYIYSIAYYSWLEKPPGDGPAIHMETPMARIEERGNLEEIVKIRSEAQSKRLNDLLLPMLRNQLDQVSEADRSGQDEWRRMLEDEIEAMEEDFHRLAWEGDLPPQIENSLKPYRDRLERLYSPLSNTLEIAFE